MNYIIQITIGAIVMIALVSCNRQQQAFDASGTFEAEETLISSEASGLIKQLTIEEGQSLEAGEQIGYIDSIQLYLKKKQLQAQIDALLSKKPQISVQLASLQEQLKSAEKEQNRVANLVKADAATPQQLDDINAQIEVIKAQIKAQKSSLEISNEGMTKDTEPLRLEIEQINDKLQKSKIINPEKGTILTKYAEENEMTTQGKALYKVADLSTIILRAYVTGDQLPAIKLNQKVKVLTDEENGGLKEAEGTISWISDKAEFTPKTIQTKDERANRVYAIKVKVENDGYYKIGMYGEIKFQ